LLVSFKIISNLKITGGGQECPPQTSFGFGPECDMHSSLQGAARTRKLPMKSSQPTLLGIPFDANSSYLRGPADAPPLIREAFHCDSSNSSTESGIELSSEPVLDAGDLDLPADGAFTAIESAVAELLDKRQTPICLGGDHSITYPIVRAFGKRFADLTLVHFDAHPDLYEEFDGNRYSHACPFARIMEEGLVKRLIQVGIRTMNTHQRKQADRFGVEVVQMRELPAFEKLKLAGPVYLSFDIDVLDPAFAPGISHREPGRDVRARSGCPFARHHRRHCRNRHRGIQPETGRVAVDRDGVRENPERDSGEDDCGVKNLNRVRGER
jgi:arginase